MTLNRGLDNVGGLTDIEREQIMNYLVYFHCIKFDILQKCDGPNISLSRDYFKLLNYNSFLIKSCRNPSSRNLQMQI